MQNLKYEVGDNTGGLERLFYVPVEDILYVPQPVGSTITDDILLQAGKKWYFADFTVDTIGFSCDGSQGKNGTGYKNQVKALAAKNNPNLASWLLEMDNRRFALLCLDNNGQYNLVGDVENYLTFKSAFDTGNSASGRNSLQVNWAGDSIHPTYFYQGAIEVYYEQIQSGNGLILGLENGFVLGL